MVEEKQSSEKAAASAEGIDESGDTKKRDVKEDKKDEMVRFYCSYFMKVSQKLTYPIAMAAVVSKTEER